MFNISKKRSKKILRKRQQKSGIKKRLHRYEKVLLKAGIGAGICIFLLGIGVLGKATLFSAKNTISYITFAPESIELYDDPEIYTSIQEFVEGKNYYLLKWNSMNDLKQEIIERFPLVKEILIEQSGAQRVFITVDFHIPSIVFRSPSGYTAAYKDTLYPLVSGNTLGQKTLTVDIPRYTSGYTSLHGILYNIDEEKLVEYISTIQDTLGEKYISEIIYLPGGLKLFITYKGKKVYFHLDQEVNRQLAKLVDLENWFDDFENIRVIDLGSIDDIIVR